MKKVDLHSLLPSENSPKYEKLKNESPYSFLLEYSKVFNEKYKGKLIANVTESFQLRTRTNYDEVKENLVVALYFQAAIGNGYLYRLLEVEQIKNEPFPVRVKVFQNNPGTLGTYKGYENFYSDITTFLGSGFVQTLILNLLAQVDLYRESRKGDKL